MSQGFGGNWSSLVSFILEKTKAEALELLPGRSFVSGFVSHCHLSCSPGEINEMSDVHSVVLDSLTFLCAIKLHIREAMRKNDVR